MASVVHWQVCAFHADWRKSNPETSLARLLLIQSVAGCLCSAPPPLTRVVGISSIAARELVLWRVGCVSGTAARKLAREPRCRKHTWLIARLLVYWRMASSSVPPPAALECTRFASLVNEKKKLRVCMNRTLHTRPEPWQVYWMGRTFKSSSKPDDFQPVLVHQSLSQKHHSNYLACIQLFKILYGFEIITVLVLRIFSLDFCVFWNHYHYFPHYSSFWSSVCSSHILWLLTRPSVYFSTSSPPTGIKRIPLINVLAASLTRLVQPVKVPHSCNVSEFCMAPNFSKCLISVFLSVSIFLSPFKSYALPTHTLHLTLHPNPRARLQVRAPAWRETWPLVFLTFFLSLSHSPFQSYRPWHPNPPSLFWSWVIQWPSTISSTSLYYSVSACMSTSFPLSVTPHPLLSSLFSASLSLPWQS